jgi:hypothetical protein
MSNPHPNPAVADQHATVPQLHARAANDYAQAEAARQQQSNRDNT